MAEVSSGTARAVHVFDRGGTAVGRNRFEGGRAHRDDIDLLFGLDGRNGISGIDRTLVGLVALHARDVGDLLHVQEGGRARHHVLAEGIGRRPDDAIAFRQFRHHRGDRFGELVIEIGGIRDEDLGHALDLGGGFTGRTATAADDGDMDVAAGRFRGCNGIKRVRQNFRAVVFCDDKIAHVLRSPQIGAGQMTLASFFSLSTSSATDDTLIPALRGGGSTTFSVLRRGAVSTPRSDAAIVSIGFFFAFMIFGSEA